MALRPSLAVLGAVMSLGLSGCSLANGAEGRSAGPTTLVASAAPSAGASFAVAEVRTGRASKPRGDGVDLAASDPGRWPEPSAEQLDQLGAGVPSGSSLPDTIDPERAIAAIGHQTIVRASPSHTATKLGYLRVGAVVHRSAEPVGYSGCSEGWYAIDPEGYVCVGQNATLDLEYPLVAAARRRAERDAPLPYRYGLARSPTPAFYVKIPTPAEQRVEETDLDRHLAVADRDAWSDVGLVPVPALLRDGQRSPTVRRLRYPRPTVSLGHAEGKSGFALLEFFESGGRRWALNAELEVMALDRLRPVEPSSFRGLPLDDELTLPVAFVHTRQARAHTGDPAQGLVPGRVLGFREALPLTGRTARLSGERYLETRSGEWVKDERLIRVDGLRRRPGWAAAGRTWIDVSILEQSLVAYEGTKPVYVTLVSTGIDGLGDPEQTHSTIRGQFLVHTKHLTITMDGDEVGDEFDLRDVPYVQYFTAGYAIHAAYWHDGFGLPRSHGCINLSPIDAAWLFEWTDPPLPERWHGAMSLRDGTLVHVHP
ncbi:MAG: L,D-transpeptidase [Polyangiaceae bacterium]|nr:L,D-transpeptidase [Polyangiaceae bacterium]